MHKLMSESWASLLVLAVGMGATVTSADENGCTAAKRPSLVVQVDGDCDEKVWNRARQFWESGEPEDREWAKRILLENLQDWDSHCKSVIKRLLESLGRHQIEGSVEILERYLSQDLSLPWAETIVAKAAKALAEYGSVGFDSLANAASSSSDRIATAGVLALGRCGDERAVLLLEKFTHREEPEVRHNAWVALSYYCPDSLIDAAVSTFSASVGTVRSGTIVFLAACGQNSDVAIVADALTDPQEEVGVEALRGLVKREIRVGCERVPELIRDESNVVRELAFEYGKFCARPAPHIGRETRDLLEETELNQTASR